MKGRLACGLQDFERAKRLYTYGLYLEPMHCELLHARAFVLLQLHRALEALEDAKTAVSLGYLEAIYVEIEALRELNRVEEAHSLVLEHISEDSIVLLDFRRALEQELAAKQVILPGEALERAKITTLLSWLQSAGASFPNLNIHYYSSDNRGIHSSAYIPAYTQLLFIPKSHLITLQMAANSPIGEALAFTSLRSPKHSLLAAFLLYEDRNEDSFWRPFLNLLPRKFDSYPTNYDETELKSLTGSPFLSIILQKIADIETDYKFICGIEPDFESFSLADFTRMRLILSSRTFAMTIDREATDALVPFADMLNHKRPQKTTWCYDSEANGFIVQALEDITRREEVQVSYGRKSNYRYLLSYGFLVEENEVNEIPIDVGLDQDDLLWTAKRALIVTHQLPFRLLLVSDLREQSTQDAFSILRFIHCSDIHLLSCLSQETDQFPFSIPPISIANEIEVLRRLLSLVTVHLQAYPTTLADDLQALAQPLAENSRNIKVILKGDKEVLEWFRSLAETSLACFQTCAIPSDVSASPYAAYLLEVVSPLLSL